MSPTEAIRYYEIAVEYGDRDELKPVLAQLCFEQGKINAVQNTEEAIRYFDKAILLGHEEAKEALVSLCIRLGKAHESSDLNAAIRHYEKVAQFKNPGVEKTLANLYLSKGKTIELKHPQKAIAFYQKAIDLGCSKAMPALFKVYYNLSKIEESKGCIEEAIVYMELACKWRCAEGIQRFGKMWDQFGRNHASDGHYIEAIAAFEKSIACDWNGKENALIHLAETQFKLGSSYNQEKDYEQAIKWLTLASQANFPQSVEAKRELAETQFKLGILYKEQRNYDQSSKWLFLAAQADFPQAFEAKRELAEVRFQRGLLLEKINLKTAKDLFKSAAELGHVGAMERCKYYQRNWLSQKLHPLLTA